MINRWQNIKILKEDQSFENALKLGQFDGFKNRTLIMIDIDNFHIFNKELGREAGDLLLEDFWELIVNSIPENTYALRYGGEEFLIVTNGKEIAKEIAENLKNDFKNLKSNILNITLSFGIGELPINSDINFVIERFNNISLAAQHTAKNEGRNKVIYIN